MHMFDETKHDRDLAGRFTEMTGAEQTDSLSVPALGTTDVVLAEYHRRVRESWPRYVHLREDAVNAAATILAERYPHASSIQLHVDFDKHEDWVSVAGIDGDGPGLNEADTDRLNDVFRAVAFDWGDLLALPGAEEADGGEQVTLALTAPSSAPIELDFTAIPEPVREPERTS